LVRSGSIAVVRAVSSWTSSRRPAISTIIPRWEWRAFGGHFGPAEARLGELPPGEAQESDELYLLSENGDNVKVRGGLIDIKALREVDDDGLERWMPVMKAGFPLSAADAARVLASLRIPSPSLSRTEYTLDRFVEELVEPSGVVRTVKVHKRRVHHELEGCRAELADVEAEGRSTRTIAIESEDAGAVTAAVRDLGLDGYENISYRRGLRMLVRGESARYAVIDLGTNSVKFHIGERDADGAWRAIVDRAEMTRLGEGLDEHGEIVPQALERTAASIAAMVDEARRNHALAIVAVGTAGMRAARNRDDVIAAIRERAGVTVEVLPGEEEGRLAYLAARAGLGPSEGSVAVFDTGGGSTEFTFGHGEQVDERFSVDVGAVRYTERFGLAGEVTTEALGDALAAISADLSDIDGRPAPDALVAMGGAVTNMAAVRHGLATYDPDVVQGSVLDLAEVDRQIELYRSRDAEARQAIVGLQPKRADIILAGASIVRTIMEKLGREALTVSDRGLRHGLLVARFGEGAQPSGAAS
jgi:exopolyphosphatase/guanosine-5'-triphosphate,3'-diphosphate pyrophosphatase